MTLTGYFTTVTKQPEAHLILVTPAMATDFLERNHTNRDLKVVSIEKFGGLIESGEFKTTHQGIAFDVHGELIDGQNRLHAIIKTGIATLLWVFTGLAVDCRDAIDNGTGRSFTDAQAVKGIKLPPLYQATLRHMFVNLNRFDLSSNVVMERLKQQHDVAVLFSLECFAHEGTSRHIRIAPITAVVARAFYSKDKDRLKEFGRLLCTGFGTKPSDFMAIVLRNWVIDDTRDRHDRREVYRKTERALQIFLEERVVKKLYEADRELFPLPDEERNEKKVA